MSLPVSIENPHLWMPNGWGEPSLYKFTASLSVDGVEIAKQERNVGLRTVRVVMDDDEHGKSFYFVVNGKPMFAKGANFIPDDALLPNVTQERYKRIFEDVKAANMNMLRVWGGGIYEDDEFYDEADRNGILIWQDFMFACSSYPHDPLFVGRVEAEAEYNIKRLRGHASLAMWCGNNEIYEAMRYWGWQRNTLLRLLQGWSVDTTCCSVSCCRRWWRGSTTADSICTARHTKPTGDAPTAGRQATATTGAHGTDASRSRVSTRTCRAL